MKRPLTWKLDCVFLDKFYGHLNVGIFPDIPIGTRWVFPVLWKNMSLKAHGGCSMLSLFFSRECLISVFVLVFYPLVSSSSASAMSMASWNPLGVISHNRSHCGHGRYPAFMRLHFNHRTVPTGGNTSFPDICEARKEPLRVPSHAPSKGTTRLIDASSAVKDSQYCLMTGHVFNCLFAMFTSVTNTQPSTKNSFIVDFCPLLNGSLLVDFPTASSQRQVWWPYNLR